jgi:ABC-2 type transport system ATP-binding protein
LFEQKTELMQKLGRKQMILHLAEPLPAIPPALAGYALELSADGTDLVYTDDTQAERLGITSLLGELRAAGIDFRDLETKQSSLEEIFVSLVRDGR